MLKILFFSLLLLFLNACSTKEPALKHQLPQKCEFYSLKTALCLNQDQMVEALAPYQVIFIGDHHTEDEMHQKVASLIRAFSKKEIKIHFASEWFYPTDNKVLEQFAHKEINATDFKKEINWKKRLKYNKYKSFSPMYQAVRENGGELYGINLSKKERKRISAQDLAEMSKEELSFNNTLDLKVKPHKALIMPFLSHCHAPKKDETLEQCQERMYRVQVAWDSKMALESYKLSKKLKKNEKLIVFAGAMHIETGSGIPLRFARLTNKPFVTIIPEGTETKEVDNGTGDYLLFYTTKEAKP